MIERLTKICLWLFGFIVLVLILKIPIPSEEITYNHWNLPLSGKVIVLDPGHGGPDGGAVATDETSEKEIALEVSKLLRNYLQQSGAIVYMTRETDKDLAGEGRASLSSRKAEDIRNRLAFIEQHDPDLFLSIHLNSVPSSRWRGAQTFYYPKFDKSRHLAMMVQEEIIRNLENTHRKALAINNVYLLKYSPVPSALIEIGFLSNPDERELLKQSSYQKQMANSIYLGVLRYATEEDSEDDTFLFKK